MIERLPPLSSGPNARGPFIALQRSPELMDRLQKVGEYVRYRTVLQPKLSEFAMLIVSRHLTQEFEWQVHYPLALKAGLKKEVADALAQGARPRGMEEPEEGVHDFCVELLHSHGVSEATYQRLLAQLGEQGVVELVALVGYFITVSLVLNVAHTPAAAREAPPLEPFPA